jgi:hypothetical protein
MLIMIENLEGKTQEFAIYCFHNQSKELIEAAIQSVKHDEEECEKWDISPVQWLEAKQAALHKILRNEEQKKIL